MLLIVAIAANKLWPLMFLHVAGGAAWTIIDLFLGLVLGPIMGKMSVPARVEFTTRLMPKMVLIMPTVVTMTLAAGWQLGVKTGNVVSSSPNHGWVVASFIIVGVMSVLALGLLEPANIAVLFELKKPRPKPEVIERLMKRFIYCAGILGLMQVATLVIMTKLGLVMTERRLPPVTQVAMVSLALIVAGGIYLSAHIPAACAARPRDRAARRISVAAGRQLASLARVREFPWSRFFEVAKWSLLAYALIAGMIEYAFLQNHLRGGALVVLTLSLVVFAVHVPTLIGFTVARYYEPETASLAARTTERSCGRPARSSSSGTWRTTTTAIGSRPTAIAMTSTS